MMKRWGWLVLVAMAAAGGLACDFILDGRAPGFTGFDPGAPTYTPKTFVNWETPHVSPIALSANGSRLFVVNTPAARLEILRADSESASSNGLGSDGLLPDGFVPVGLEPVSVRVRTADKVWVVNHLSDSVSIVDLAARNVVRTLRVGDEPTDVAFAAGKAFVVCSQVNHVEVFDLADLDAAPQIVTIEGEDPRALAVSADSRHIYAAIFDSGNRTTVLGFEQVSDLDGPYAGRNPPPNTSIGFDPPLAERTVWPPQTGLIVRWDTVRGAWLDERGADWTFAAPWRLHDHDVAVIDTETLAVDYVRGLMNLNMHLAVRADGVVTVVGTEASNDHRFEPNLTAQFVRSRIAFVDSVDATGGTVRDLNPHLLAAYASRTTRISEAERARSIADPRAIVWDAAGRIGYVAGQGSNNVAKINDAGDRLGQVDVGAGPSGLALDENSQRLYILNRFDASVSIVDTATLAEVGRVGMFDPTPAEIVEGRKFLYDARLTSGLGVTACASCHIDGRTDHLGWDLGDPTLLVKPFDQFCDPLIPLIDNGECRDFHPLKGPMMTQTLQGMVGNEPLHWRGDRENLAAFAPAFVTLNGAAHEPTATEMRTFEKFLVTIAFPPNPHRQMDNSLPAKLMGADPREGRRLFTRGLIDRGPVDVFPILSCNRCHSLPTGTDHRNVRAAALFSPQGMKVPHLRNVYEKTGFLKTPGEHNCGFGLTHDGSLATLDEFLSHPAFDFGPGDEGVRKRRDVIAFVMAMGTDTHAGVGYQVTLTGDAVNDQAAGATLDGMLALADARQVGLIVKGVLRGRQRGYAYSGNGIFRSDRTGQAVSADSLRSTTPGSERTWTLVPLGSETRLGIDADLDGVLDGDEVE